MPSSDDDTPDPFDILGIAYSSTPDEIKDAYRKLAILHHPDKGGDPDQFIRINTAYELLRDPETKSEYDSARSPDNRSPDHPPPRPPPPHPPPPESPINRPIESMSPEQERAFDLYKDGKNVFLTGPGGTGKTHLIREIYADAKRNGRRIQVCAMTGCAALLLDCAAKTVHSWAGIGLAKGDAGTICSAICLNKYKKKPWVTTDILVIDEVSMMSSRMISLLDQIGRMTRKRPTEAFGGIQVIFSGDFFQLPPISTRDEPADFCFEYIDWPKIFPHTVSLTRLFRQTDAVYGKVLNEIRVGRITRSSLRVIAARREATERLDAQLASNKEDQPPPIPLLFPTRRQVDGLNTRNYASLAGKELVFRLAEMTPSEMDLNPQERRMYDIHSKKDKEWEIKRLTESINANPVLRLKMGTPVMCVLNIDMDRHDAVANGSQGVVVGWTVGDTPFPVIRFRNGLVRRIGFSAFKSESLVGVHVKQVPLIHAWAVSIHKSQGATMDAARLDLGSSIFECGQTYVAMSRIKSLDGLFIDSFDPAKVKVNRKVKAFYESL
jgi:ATP-dependent DNA helicase PIF1